MKAKSKKEMIFQVTSKKEKVKNMGFKARNSLLVNSAIFAFLLFTFCVVPVKAQEQPPTPSAPRSAKIPAVVEKMLPNGLKVAIVERKNVPLVTVELLVKRGASWESLEKAGLANLTAQMLTKGTKTRSASQIAEQVEFLGGSISTAAGWNNSVVQITVTNDKLDKAMAILADLVLNPAFKQEELDLLKSQTLDGLAYNLKQPGFLANYVAAKYSYDEHPAGGTPESLNAIQRTDIVAFHDDFYKTANSVLIFTGDIAAVQANALAQKYFGVWKKPPVEKILRSLPLNSPSKDAKLVNRLLVVDLPDSGQASVNYSKKVKAGRVNALSNFYYASVLNSVLGGGYSSRLNQEIRIKRGLSYGAGSSFAWRFGESNFGTRTQTKNESAAEVAELVLAELQRLSDSNVPANELAPRKLVLTGDFGRDLETTVGLADKVGELYSFDLPATEMNNFISNVEAVSDSQIKEFSEAFLRGGDLIIVGDYKVFKEDLAKRFPNMKIEVVEAGQLDLSKDNLRK